MLNLIVAIDKQYGIAKDGRIPWNIPEDMQFFARTTKRVNDPSKMNAVIMGKNTWKSFPNGGLVDRVNVIVSTTMTLDELDDDNTSGEICVLVRSLDEALKKCDQTNSIENIYVIGGVNVYTEALNRCIIDNIYITRVDDDAGCDLFFPRIAFKKYLVDNDVTKEILKSKNNIIKHYIYHTNTRKLDGEYQYLNLLEDILRLDPAGRQTRNAICHSIFAPTALTFDLQKGFPLLTTKKVHWRGILEELLFFLRGDTNVNHLNNKGVKIWNANTSRDFLDMLGLKDYKKGDMGPLYGFSLRHIGCEYKGMNHDYTGRGFDQLRYVIDLLKRDPMSRRIIMTTFNAKECGEGKCVLYPCHGLITQFYVRDNTYLDCSTYQRSVDTSIGLPYNIASYSLLVHIIAHVTGYQPGILTTNMGDTHIYHSHINAVKTQLTRKPYEFPELKIIKQLKENKLDDIIKFIETLKFNDFELLNYKYHPILKMKMVA